MVGKEPFDSGGDDGGEDEENRSKFETSVTVEELDRSTVTI